MKHASPDAIGVLAMPAVFPDRERVHVMMPAGSTIEEIVAGALPGLPARERALVRVKIGGHEILPGAWRARPKPGSLVTLRILPAGATLRSALSLVVLVAAIVVAPYLVPGAATLAAVGLTAAQATAIATTAIAAAGMLLLNALIPVQQDAVDSKGTYAIPGWRNVENAGGPVPAVLGSHRYAPPYAAASYTEVVGEDQYIRALFNFGYGPVDITNIRIGETSIDEYDGVEMELREGYPSDAPVTLYPTQVIEDQLSIELRYDYADAAAGEDGELKPQIRRTQPDVTAISVDLTCPSGLGFTTSEGGFAASYITVDIDYRKVGDAAWTVLQNDYRISATSHDPVRRSLRWNVPVRGQYDVRVTRTLRNHRATSVHIDTLYWTALRSYRPEYPIAFRHPLALLAVRIKASAQLNGTLDTLSADVARVCPDWDAETQTWIARTTRNPASLFRWALQGPACHKPVANEGIDLDLLADWHEFCEAKGLAYDYNHDADATLGDILTAIAAAGRATWRDDGRKIGVVIDRPQTQVVSALTPRNSVNFEWSRDYIDPPDGFRVSFPDRTNDFAQAERVIEWPDFEGDPQVIEDLHLPGVTDPTQVWKAARRRQLELIHRLDRYSADQGMEALDNARGDLVLINQDVLDRVHVAARVKAVSGSAVELDCIVTIAADTAYGIRFRKPDGTSWFRAISASEGDQTVVTLTGAGAVPEAGDMALFGIAGQEVVEAIVNRIERADNFGAKLHLLPHAPQIDAILDAYEVPTWSPRVGEIIAPPSTAPTAPRMLIVSGALAAEEGDVDGPYINVTLSPGIGTAIPIRSYDLDHRLAGAGTWTSLSPADGVTDVRLLGYSKGDEVELRARATSIASVDGPWSATVTHEVGATDPVGAAPPDAPSGLAAPVTGSEVDLVAVAPNSPDFSALRFWRASSGAGFGAATDISGAIFGAPNATLSYTDLPGTGSWDYWATAENAEGDQSSPDGPVTATVS